MDYFKEGNISIFSIHQQDLEYHSHSFFELVYITKGRGIHYLDGDEMIVTEGDYFIIDYGSQHKYKTVDESGFELINCLFLPEFIDPSLKKCESFGDVLSNYLIRFGSATYSCKPTRCTYKDDDKTVKKIMLSMMEEFTENKKGSMEIMRCRLVEILILTMRKILENSTGNIDNVISAVIKYVDNGFGSQIRLSDIAERLRMSPQYLSVKFKNVMGMTFMDYVQKVRIGQSCRMLAVSDKKIIEIAELSGYSDVKFFNYVFKKHMNATPCEFRRRIRAK